MSILSLDFVPRFQEQGAFVNNTKLMVEKISQTVYGLISLSLGLISLTIYRRRIEDAERSVSISTSR